MRRYATRFLFNLEDAEDLVQEVFIKAFTNIQSFDSKRKFSSWLYRIAHNTFINAIKKKGREPIPFFDPDTLSPHPVAKETADGKLISQEIKEEINNHLNKLKPKYREILVLYFLEELSYQEISDILHIPISTVGVRLTRAKTQIKKLKLK